MISVLLQFRKGMHDNHHLNLNQKLLQQSKHQWKSPATFHSLKSGQKQHKYLKERKPHNKGDSSKMDLSTITPAGQSKHTHLQTRQRWKHGECHHLPRDTLMQLKCSPK